MTNTEDKSNSGKKIGISLLSGCGTALLTFVIITTCVALVFPFVVTANGVESQ